MAFYGANTVTTDNKPVINSNNIPTSQGPDYQLVPEELVFLLNSLKNSTFTGHQIEIVYNTITKLQNQYLQQTKQ